MTDQTNRPPYETFKFATCRGCYALGTACGHCEKCDWEKSRLAPSSTPPSSAPETLTSYQRMLLLDLARGYRSTSPEMAAIATAIRICDAASHSSGTPAPAGGTLTACQRAVYYCMACPLTFPDAASSNAHHDATGHNQTWRPVMAFHARNPAATAASGIGTTEDADCFDELTESAAVNDVLASMARDYPGSVARVVRYLREVKADRDRMDWWEAHLPESIYWKDRGGNLKQGTTMRRFTDAARASVSRDASLPKSAEQQVAARSSTESPQ